MILLPLFHLPRHGLCIRAPGRQGWSSFLFFWCTLRSMQHSVFDPCSSLNPALLLIIVRVLCFEFHTLAAPWQHENRRARRGDTLAISPSLAVAAAAAATSASVSWTKVRNRNRKIPSSEKQTRNRRSNTTSNKKSGSKKNGEAV